MFTGLHCCKYLCLQKTGTNIKVYSECCPDSTERIVAIAGKPEPVVNCIDTIFELLETVSIHQGPVVQSIVSLTSSLRVISLTTLAVSIHNALQKLLTFFQQKISAYLLITRCKF